MLEMNSSYLNVLNRICGEVQKIMALKKENEIDWENVNVEVLFLYTMVGYKPVGVNRHFMMLLIHNKFSDIINHQISSKLLWDHLDTMYDLAALHESEIIPFPNDEVDFELPEDCHQLLFSKYGVSLKPSSSENESAKNSTNSKASKKPSTPKLKQSNTPVATSKSNFATPTVKPLKSETKTSSGDGTMKVKQDLSLSAKANKIKRSSSPFSNKVVKPESLPVTKEDSADISSVKKSKERGSSPATTKKLLKVEPSSTSSSSKKPAKVESNANASKPVKVDTSEGSTKKIKVDKDLVNKKGKTSTSNSDNTPVSKKTLKTENVNKKKHDDNTPKKTSESSSVKHPKSEVKSSSHSSRQDSETPPPTGSRKSSPVVKVKSTESSKKKRPREETSKKSIPGSKRRRV